VALERLDLCGQLLERLRKGAFYYAGASLLASHDFEDFKAIMLKTVDKLQEAPLLCASYKDGDGDTVYIGTNAALNAFFVQCNDESTVKIVLKEVDSGKEAEIRSALFMREGSASEIRKRRDNSNMLGNGALEPAMRDGVSHVVHQLRDKYAGLMRESTYRKAWLEKMCLTPQGRKFLGATSLQAMQAHLRGRANIQKGLAEHLSKVAAYRKDVNARQKAIFVGHSSPKTDVIGHSTKKAMQSQKNLSDVLTVFAGVYLETFKSKADPQYLESLQRFRVILGSMAKFYNDYIYEYAVKLDTAKETMVAFHKANPEYDAEDDADDELGELIRDQQFETPSSIDATLDGDMQWPPCEGGGRGV